MVTRPAAADRSPQPGMHEGAAADAPPGPRAAAGGQPRAWSGGRWLVWLGRAIVWLVLLLVGYNGVVAIVTRQSQPAPRPAVSHRTGFPASLAAAYALEFGQVYLNASPATAAQRASRLASFLPQGTDPQLGWNGSGTLRLGFEQVAGVRAIDRRHGVVTLLAEVNGHPMELGVPVYAGRHGMAISGEPAWLPAPSRVNVPSSSQATSDSATQAVLMSQLPSFFQAYASGNQATLARFLAPGALITGLGGQVSFGSLTALDVPAGGSTRNVTATVAWRVPGQPVNGRPVPPASLEMTYALRLEKLGGAWYVRDISPSLQPAGPP